MRHRRALCAPPLLFPSLLSAYTQDSNSARTSAQLSKLQSRLREFSDVFPGAAGVAVRDIKAGEEISICDFCDAVRQ